MSTLYTAAAMSTGEGRNGHVRTSDGRVDLDLAIPKEMGGSGNGSNPEQLFAAGYASCFHSAIKLIAGQRKLKIDDSAVSADVGIGPNDAGGFALSVALHVELPGLDQSAADELVEAAHQVCPYSNATRGNIPVTVDATVD
jgi:osmotically inducible protein OsmC